MLMNAVTMIRYWIILHQISRNGQFGITKSVAVNGVQNITNNGSAIVGLTTRMIAFDLVVFSLSITNTVREFPIKLKMPIVVKNNGINILTIFYIISRSRLSSHFSYSTISVANCELQLPNMLVKFAHAVPDMLSI